MRAATPVKLLPGPASLVRVPRGVFRFARTLSVGRRIEKAQSRFNVELPRLCASVGEHNPDDLARFLEADVVRGCACAASSLPRVDDQRSRWREVIDVSCHDVQSMTACGRGDESVLHAHRPSNATCGGIQFAPQPCDLGVHGQDSVRESDLKTVQPGGQLPSSPSLVKPRDSRSEFAQGNGAQVRIVLGEMGDRVFDRGCASRTTNLGYDTGIEKNPHRRRSRITDGCRRRSTPSSEGPSMR